MKFSLAIAVVLAGLGASGLAQQQKMFVHIKPAEDSKAEKRAPLPLPKTSAVSGGSSSNAKDLNALEHQTKVTTSTRQPGVKRASAVKLPKEQRTPPINFGGAVAKSSGGNAQPANPYKGRLKQKGSHH